MKNEQRRDYAPTYYGGQKVGTCVFINNGQVICDRGYVGDDDDEKVSNAFSDVSEGLRASKQNKFTQNTTTTNKQNACCTFQIKALSGTKVCIYYFLTL